MAFYTIFIFLAVSVAHSTAVKIVYGSENSKTKLLSIRNAYFDKMATVTFNKDKEYDLTIDKVDVVHVRDELESKITEGGPGQPSVTLQLTGLGQDKGWAGVFVYGRMNKGRVRDIKKGAIKFNNAK